MLLSNLLVMCGLWNDVISIKFLTFDPKTTLLSFNKLRVLGRLREGKNLKSLYFWSLNNHKEKERGKLGKELTNSILGIKISLSEKRYLSRTWIFQLIVFNFRYSGKGLNIFVISANSICTSQSW